MNQKLETVRDAVADTLATWRTPPIKPATVMGTGHKFDHNTLSGFLRDVKDRLWPRYTFQFDEDFVTDALKLDMVELTVKVDEKTR